jgi:hypothetical protein
MLYLSAVAMMATAPRNHMRMRQTRPLLATCMPEQREEAQARMSEPSKTLAGRIPQPGAGIKLWRVLVFLATLLVASALTYGWNALSDAFGGLPVLPYVLRVALSVPLVFLGAFAFTGLWLAPAAHSPSPEAVAPITATPVPYTGEPDNRDPAMGMDPVLIHLPVRAADLPRILFDTDEIPAITTLRKNTTHAATEPAPPPLEQLQLPTSEE